MPPVTMTSLMFRRPFDELGALGRGCVSPDPAVDDMALWVIEFAKDELTEPTLGKVLLRIAVNVAVADDQRTVG